MVSGKNLTEEGDEDSEQISKHGIFFLGGGHVVNRREVDRRRRVSSRGELVKGTKNREESKRGINW